MNLAGPSPGAACRVLLLLALAALPAGPALAGATGAPEPSTPATGGAGGAGGAGSDGFTEWLAGLRAEARSRDISEETLDAALSGIQPLERVLELDRKQPEFTLTLDEYLRRAVSDTRIERGRRALANHRELLAQVADRFGVQPRFIVALWGIESNYGQTPGSFQVVEALATLAYDGRRSSFFRGELLHALEILEQGHTDPSGFAGSWAGATGQTQFMPSSFLAYAVDFDGDGRRDIWNDPADVLASIANYLARHGWRDDQTWGRPVHLPEAFDIELIGRRKPARALPEWQALGVRRANGQDLPGRSLPARIVRPDEHGRSYVVYDNFQTLMRWNASEYFGVAVGTLADRLAGG